MLDHPVFSSCWRAGDEGVDTDQLLGKRAVPLSS